MSGSLEIPANLIRPAITAEEAARYQRIVSDVAKIVGRVFKCHTLYLTTEPSDTDKQRARRCADVQKFVGEVADDLIVTLAKYVAGESPKRSTVKTVERDQDGNITRIVEG